MMPVVVRRGRPRVVREPLGGGRARPARATSSSGCPAAQVCIPGRYVKASAPGAGAESTCASCRHHAHARASDKGAQRTPSRPAAERARFRSERPKRSRRAAHTTPPGPRAPVRWTLIRAGRGRAGDVIKRAAHTDLSVWVEARRTQVHSGYADSFLATAAAKRRGARGRCAGCVLACTALSRSIDTCV